MSRLKAVLFILIVALGFGVAMAARGDLTLPLKFTPTKVTAQATPALEAAALAQPIRLVVVDERTVQDRTVVGDGSDDDDSRFAVKTPDGDDLRALGAEAFRKLAAGWGLKLDDSATTVLTITITQWFLSEKNQAVGSNYAANVTLRGELRQAEGGSLWRGVAQGDARRYGKKQSTANYNEVSSDAAQQTLATLLSTPGLNDALQGRPSAGTPGPPPAAALAPVTPDELLQRVLELIKGGFSESFLVEFVSKQSVKPAMTTADMLKWKDAGVSEKVIASAAGRGSP